MSAVDDAIRALSDERTRLRRELADLDAKIDSLSVRGEFTPRASRITIPGEAINEVVDFVSQNGTIRSWQVAKRFNLSRAAANARLFCALRRKRIIKVARGLYSIPLEVPHA